MRFSPKLLLALALLLPTQWLAAERVERVVDIPTRTGVSMRMLVLKPAAPKAAVLLLAGGHGGLQIFPGTQSAAHVAVQVQGPSAPDGVVLASSILRDERSPAVSAMALERIQRPVLVVHHVQDGCAVCSYADVPALMDKLKGNNRSQLMAFQGGQNVVEPCHALAYHGFHGIESQVVQQIAGWILAR